MSERMELALVEAISLMFCMIEDMHTDGKCSTDDLVELKKRITEMRNHTFATRHPDPNE